MVSTALALSILAGYSNLAAAEFYVATDGNDAWSGRLATPNAQRTDGPFATLSHARDAVRTARERDAKPRPHTVLVRGGTYFLDDTFVLAPHDSGAEGAPVTYAAYPGERPVLSAGRVIENWRQGEGGPWVADLPEVKAGRWHFHQLFVDGQRRRRARSPNEFYYRMKLLHFTDPKGKPHASHRRFRFGKGDVERWDNLHDVQIIAFFNWYTTHHWISDVDEEHRIVQLSSRSRRPFGRAAEPEQRYIVVNCREALDAPGEWYLDRKTGRLTYYPMPGENLREVQVIAPVLKEIVRFEGDADAGLFVEHLTLRGLSFQHSDWDLPRDCAADAQNHRSMKSQAIFARGLLHSTFEDCEIAHVGAFALWLERGCKDVRVERCHLHDLGAGGIRVGEDDPPESEEQVTERIVIDNNFIHDSSHVFHAGIGVWISHCPHNRVTRNEICDLDYTGISVGWRWDPRESFAHHNLVEGNHIHHLGRAVLSDLAGVYMLGKSPDTIVRNNVIHDVCSYSYGGWGLYGDAYSRDMVFEKNLCYRTTSGGFFQNYGSNNIVRNNVFAFVKQRGQISRGTRDVEGLVLSVERNIVYNDNELVVGSRVTSSNARFDRNLYRVPEGVAAMFNGKPFSEWQASGQDQHSVFADPQFVHVESDDFRLKPDSPAFGLGFEPLDYREVGLYGAPEWVRAPDAIRREPVRIPPGPPPEPVEDDFEDTPLGSPPLAGIVRITGAETLVVTDETAAGGERSLKFTDATDQRYPWYPHLYFRPNLKQGSATFAFDLCVEPGARLMHEWRDGSHPYRVGPSIRIDPDGWLTASGKKLTEIPFGQWLRFEIAYQLGSDAVGEYGLTLTLPDCEPLRFEGLRVATSAPRELVWLGFMSLGPEKSAFYLDNLQFTCRSE